MPTNESFFSSGACGDPIYTALRDSPQAIGCKHFVEELWRDYQPYNNDPNFLTDAPKHFHQRFWEMYLCVTMLRRGFVVEKAGSKGPEFSITIDGRKIWFEAIAPEAGTTDDRVPEIEFGKGGWVPADQVLMRYTSALKAKLSKYQIDRQEIISENDIYIVAINSNKIPHAYFGSFLPYHVQAFLGIGPLTVAINPETQKMVDIYSQPRSEVKKKNNSPVSTQPFLDPAYCGISAVIHSTFDMAGYTYGNAKWGDDFDVLHNPLAANPLPFDVLHWCKYRYIRDDKLETVERTPHKHIDNPIEDWKNLQKDPEFVKDRRSWAKRKAHKILHERD